MERRPILVIDDDPRFCEFVSAALSRTSFEVLSAPDGPSGIELARKEQPAVKPGPLDMPVNMPAMAHKLPQTTPLQPTGGRKTPR